MKRKIFILTTVIMTLSLLGLIAIQIFWITKAIEDRKERLWMSFDDKLNKVSENIREKEMTNFFNFLLDKTDSISSPSITQISNLFIYYKDNTSTREFIYNNSLEEQDFQKFPFNSLENQTDSIPIKRYVSNRSFLDVEMEKGIDKNISSLKSNSLSDELNEINRSFFEISFKDFADRMEINQRIDKFTIESMLKQAFGEYGKDLTYEFAVLDKDGIVSSILSDGYPYQEIKSQSYNYNKKTPLFYDSNQLPKYYLKVNISDTFFQIFSSITTLSIFSIVFTTIIILVYFITLYQLINQRKISDIKTDFVNNMTHEFKTPIATISLALDTLKKIDYQNNLKGTVSNYLKIIKDENTRMFNQVESILNISMLEKKQDIRFEKRNIPVKNLINYAIEQIDLIVKNKKGKIETDFNDQDKKVFVSEEHFVNALVNILDNAIKYSQNEIEINITTKLVKDVIYIIIKDKGLGMNSNIVKHIFEKFYREPKGNIHNIKGHGLGLAYVKYIIDEHNATIEVDSEINKGSTFTIKIASITEK